MTVTSVTNELCPDPVCEASLILSQEPWPASAGPAATAAKDKYLCPEDKDPEGINRHVPPGWRPGDRNLREAP